MKIVIDIPEERYKDIQRIAEVQLNRRTPTVEQIVANGTPLPKNHGDLIDKNELIKMYEKDCGRRIYADNFIFDLENNTTTIIEADKEEKK